MQQLFAALRDNQEATNQFYSAVTGSSPLQVFMSQENLDRILAGAGVRDALAPRREARLRDTWVPSSESNIRS